MVAAAVTFVAALLILLFLFTCGLRFDRQLLAKASTPEIEEEEELFIEPEILEDLGEPDAVVEDEPAPAFKGEPEPAPEENTRLVVKGENPKPAPPEPKPVTQKQPSPVKATEPPKVKEEEKKVTSPKATVKGFKPRNGSESGSNGSVGAGGAGMGISGSVSGRTYKGCQKPSVELRHKVRVVVDVTINAQGRVIRAKARGGADASIRAACEQAAYSARWSEKEGAPDQKGTLTFNITPR